MPKSLEQPMSPEGSNEKLLVNKLLQEAKEAVNQLCNDCREGTAFNQAGSHGFDIHARPCKAERLRTAIAELEKVL